MVSYYKENELLTFNEFVEELSISESFAYQLLSQGTIKGIKLGKVWRIPRKSIEQYIMDKLSEAN